ncbi:hypothetical protein P152DRAFT_239609 [Eremomyces bilateralis CBS 781.70]|uniref:Uncharacterized protein n=1 Tax=Eremomyces bilateralis CBS 781.70 TaxID=1392243 RepID=A0A6G1GA97_9PEZI|nr:uncharacterized protein P152DRAFT_239609 [Eremomyces bilateralis CBS 781.70]KAF1814954.1 hypothetical protein P152DRAFT_239609 [Eremomyces bilateralis CBS 781.70]
MASDITLYTYFLSSCSSGVPVLVFSSDSSAGPFAIGQSVATMEYIVEAYSSIPAPLPPRGVLRSRALVRQLVCIVARDMQPNRI